MSTFKRRSKLPTDEMNEEDTPHKRANGSSLWDIVRTKLKIAKELQRRTDETTPTRQTKWVPKRSTVIGDRGRVPSGSTPSKNSKVIKKRIQTKKKVIAQWVPVRKVDAAGSSSVNPYVGKRGLNGSAGGRSNTTGTCLNAGVSGGNVGVVEKESTCGLNADGYLANAAASNGKNCSTDPSGNPGSPGAANPGSNSTKFLGNCGLNADGCLENAAASNGNNGSTDPSGNPGSPGAANPGSTGSTVPDGSPGGDGSPGSPSITEKLRTTCATGFYNALIAQFPPAICGGETSVRDIESGQTRLVKTNTTTMIGVLCYVSVAIVCVLLIALLMYLSSLLFHTKK